MVDSKDITPRYMQEMYEQDNLGKLVIKLRGFKSYEFKSKIPFMEKEDYNGTAEIHMDLKRIWEEITSRIKPKNIETICVYGGVLDIIKPRKVQKQRPKYFGLFGPKTIKHIEINRRKPNDLDLIVLTKEDVEDSLFFPGKENIAKIEKLKKIWTCGESRWYGEDKKFVSGFPLHLTYRSVNQFLNYLQKQDVLSCDTIKRGLPIVGEENFNKVVSMTNPISIKRNPQHTIEWDNAGKLQGYVLEKLTNIKSQSKSLSEQPIKTPPVQTEFVDPWKIKIPKLGENKK